MIACTDALPIGFKVRWRPKPFGRNRVAHSKDCGCSQYTGFEDQARDGRRNPVSVASDPYVAAPAADDHLHLALPALCDKNPRKGARCRNAQN